MIAIASRDAYDAGCDCGSDSWPSHQRTEQRLRQVQQLERLMVQARLLPPPACSPLPLHVPADASPLVLVTSTSIVHVFSRSASVSGSASESADEASENDCGSESDCCWGYGDLGDRDDEAISISIGYRVFDRRRTTCPVPFRVVPVPHARPAISPRAPIGAPPGRAENALHARPADSCIDHTLILS